MSKTVLWKPVELTEVHPPEPLAAKKIFRKLGKQLRDKMVEEYEKVTGEDFDIESIAFDTTDGVHTYVIKETMEAFFVALPTMIERREDPLTGEEKFYVISEYRIQANQTQDPTS